MSVPVNVSHLIIQIIRTTAHVHLVPPNSPPTFGIGTSMGQGGYFPPAETAVVSLESGIEVENMLTYYSSGPMIFLQESFLNVD